VIRCARSLSRQGVSNSVDRVRIIPVPVRPPRRRNWLSLGWPPARLAVAGATGLRHADWRILTYARPTSATRNSKGRTSVAQLDRGHTSGRTTTCPEEGLAPVATAMRFIEDEANPTDTPTNRR
jgi:hypothetical protein